MTPLKSCSINLKVGVVSMQESVILHIWTYSKILLFSSKVCKRLSVFLFLSFSLTCYFSSSPRLSCLTFVPFFSYFFNCFFSLSFRLSRFFFFFFCPLFSFVLFFYDQANHAFLFLFCYRVFFIIKIITHNFLFFFLVFS